jgi:uncharacterized protein GlcG (DUF336 family)
MIDAAVALVKAEKGRAAIAVVDYNGNLISMDSMDGNSRFWARFAVGKAVGAVALQVDTAVSAEQVKTNPARFQSALSMLEGEILLIPGGTPLIIDNVVVGGVGSDADGSATSAPSRPPLPPGKNFARVAASYHCPVPGSPLKGRRFR